MKLAPILAGGALAVLMLALATAKSPNPPEIKRPIDLAGIRTVQVHSKNGVEIEISTAAPHLGYKDSTKAHVRTRRDGNRLIVTADLEDWTGLALVVPPSVQRFVIDGGKVGTKLKLDDVEVLSPGNIHWQGHVRRLVLRDTSDPSKHRDDGHDAVGSKNGCTCSRHSTFSVEGGEIGELRVYSPHAELDITDADKIGVAYAWIGPKGTITITSARNFHQVHLMQAGEVAP